MREKIKASAPGEPNLRIIPSRASRSYTLAKPHYTFEQYSIIPTVVARTTCITDFRNSFSGLLFQNNFSGTTFSELIFGTTFSELLFRDCLSGTAFPGLLY